MRLLVRCLLLAALCLPAELRAETAATVTKDVSQTALETESKDVDLTVAQEARPEGTADARGELREGLEGNQVVETGGESVAYLGDCFAFSTGIVAINQSPGNCNNQGNLVSLAYVEAQGGTALLSGGAAEVLNRDNLLDAAAMARTNMIGAGAFADFAGALQVNQSAGNLNNQNNIVSIAFGGQAVVALSEAALGQQVARNSIREMAVLKQDIIAADALSGLRGIVSINQSSGCGNIQTNIIVVSVQQFL